MTSHAAIDLDAMIAELGVDKFVDDARQSSIARMLSTHDDQLSFQSTPERLPRYGFLFESRAIESFERGIAGDDEAMREARKSFSDAFQCWRALSSLQTDGASTRARVSSSAGEAMFATELGADFLAPSLGIAIRLATSGLGAQRQAEMRLELARFTNLESHHASRWSTRVLERIATAYVRLSRKGQGWADILAALDSIAELRVLQSEFEGSYLDALEDASAQTVAAVELVGLYHLAQLIQYVGDYLREGGESVAQLNAKLDRQRDRSRTAFVAARRSELIHLADLVWVGARELVQNSLWTHVSGVGESLREFASELAAAGRERPLLELWPSQQEALRKSLLDPYKRAVLVEMPTSAGKTLLAKFAIVQSHALNPKGTVAYLVPTRALVNQITLDLRADLGLIGLSVELAVPATELDPLEDKLLSEAPDILVSTPEKFDLLLKRNHPAVQGTSLVIADEAHNLRDGGRGGRLELLLGTIKRDRPDARFLLLSPFLPNDSELVSWLGDDRALPPIRVNWRPSCRIVGAVRAEGRGKKRVLAFETLPAADNVDIRDGRVIKIGPRPAEDAVTVRGLTRAIINSIGDRGATLVLCRGRGTAVTRAKEVAEDRPVRPASAEMEAVCHYLEAEVGTSSTLAECLRRGVAFHHSGLSHDARWLVEGLIRTNQVDVVCGTTTLAQGVNFPISNVIVESLRKGKDSTLSYEDFWNVAGRAGRSLVDTVGVIAFPAPNAETHGNYVEFLRGEAIAISSQLAELVERADEIIQSGFGVNAVFKWPALGTLMQFLSHAMRVSGSASISDDVEDLLRASLVYRQAQRRGRSSAEQLVRLCRAYLAHIRGHANAVALADHTGFATPSILQLQARAQGNTELRQTQNWAPDRLFGGDLVPLTLRVEAIGELPEIQLGAGTSGSFNPNKVAGILRDWVRGDTISKLADAHRISSEPDPEKRVSEFSKYLFGELLGKASWGMGALESVCLAGDDSIGATDANYIPSMIFFGVRQREAVWLRMVGVPRVIAGGLGTVWREEKRGEPSSYDDLRRWIGGLSDSDWTSAIPSGTRLSASDVRLLWRKFVG